MSLKLNIHSMMKTEQTRQELIARSLASNGLAGYKKEMLSSSFKENFEAQKQTGRVVSKVGINFEQGFLKQTDRSLDMAIKGDAFFEVESTTGNTLYTKNGSFTLDADRNLMTQEGFYVKGESGKIQLNPGDNVNTLHFGDNNSLRIVDGITGEIREVSKLKIVNFKSNNKLERRSESYFSNNDINNIDNKENYKLINNAIETSNSKPVHEMVGMIQSMRRFEMGNKILENLKTLSNAEKKTFK